MGMVCGIRGVRAGKACVQGKSRAGKIFAKKALAGKALTKKRLVAGEVLAKKKFIAGLVPVSKAVPIVKKVSAGPGCRQGPRQEGGSEPREQCKQVPKQAGGTRARKRQDNAASRDRERQGVVLRARPGKVLAKRLVAGNVRAKKKSTSGGRSKRFLAHLLHHHHHHRGHSREHGGGIHGVRAGKACVQGTSLEGKIFAKEALAGEVLTKKNFFCWPCPRWQGGPRRQEGLCRDSVPPGTEAGGRERVKGAVQAGAEAGLLGRGQEKAGQCSQPGQGGTGSCPRTPLSNGEPADEGRTEQQRDREELAAG